MVNRLVNLKLIYRTNFLRNTKTVAALVDLSHYAPNERKSKINSDFFCKTTLNR